MGDHYGELVRCGVIGVVKRTSGGVDVHSEAVPGLGGFVGICAATPLTAADTSFGNVKDSVHRVLVVAHAGDHHIIVAHVHHATIGQHAIGAVLVGHGVVYARRQGDLSTVHGVFDGNCGSDGTAGVGLRIRLHRHHTAREALGSDLEGGNGI